MGKTGWLTIIPIVFAWIIPVAAVIAFGGATILADMNDEATALAVLSSLGGMIIIVLVSWLIGFGFLIWQGVTTGDAGDNRYGPPPAAPSVA